jgi:hypothetical protein
VNIYFDGGKRPSKERAKQKAEADKAFKKLRLEVDANLALCKSIKSEALKNLTVNDPAVQSLAARFQCEALEKVYHLSNRYIAKKTQKHEAFIKTLFYTKRKIDDIKRLPALSSKELALIRQPRLAVRLSHLRDYLNALRTALSN